MKRVNQIFKSTLLFMSGIFLMTACTKDFLNRGDLNGLGETLPSNSRSNLIFDEMDIYVAGYEGNAAKVWKNGIATNLTKGVLPAEAKSVFVVNGTVYVAGREGSQAKLWVNGVGTNLANGSIAKSVFVKDGDVYVGGWGLVNNKTTGIIWKNGVPHYLSDGNQYHTCKVNSVYAYGQDIYAAGVDDWGFAIPTIWKNYEEFISSYQYEGEAMSVFINGSVVFAAGMYEGKAIYWRNNTGYTLPSVPNASGEIASSANSIFVATRDVIITGYDNGKAKLWINGNGSYIQNMTSGNSVVVANKKICIAGKGSLGSHTVAKLYIDGTVFSLTDGTKSSAGESIFVVTKQTGVKY